MMPKGLKKIPKKARKTGSVGKSQVPQKHWGADRSKKKKEARWRNHEKEGGCQAPSLWVGRAGGQTQKGGVGGS